MLSVIKASAGSGKTHRLTYEYLKLILPYPQKYRHVLAVTFTNKATAEMKSRIIEELDLLATSPTESGHLNNLRADTGLQMNEIQLKAEETLVAILFDYSHFNVSTIDSFFQQAIRSFIRELGIHGGFSLEMNAKLVLQAAVDRLFVKLDEGEHKQLFHWLTEYYLSRSEEGQSWNIKSSIVRLSEQLLKESYKTLIKQYHEVGKVLSPEALKPYRSHLLQQKSNFENEIKQRAETFIKALLERNLQLSDLKGTSWKQLQSVACGEKVAITDALFKVQGNVQAWYRKKDYKEEIIRVFYTSEGARLLDELLNYYLEQKRRYLSIIHILKNIYALGILSDVAQEIEEYSKENNLILMSKSAELLNGLIDGSSTPFIYEKIALFIEHYMIDEFQDTSDLQWSNFEPLVTEALDQSGDSLIVGDVKQSIYRWRDSNWKLLGEEIPRRFATQIKDDNLVENWRSGRNIVAFNNSFFRDQTAKLAESLEETLGDVSSLTRVYSDELIQYIPKANEDFEGHVRIELFDVEDVVDGVNEEKTTKKLSKEQYEQIALKQLPKTIESLAEKGFRRGDVGILVRTNREAKLVVSSLLDYKQQNPERGDLFELISQEGLLIDNAQSVNLMVGLLHFLHDPNQKIYQYFVDKAGELCETMRRVAPNETEIKELRSYSLYELCEQIVGRFIIQEYGDEIAFIEAFLDLVYSYSSDNPTDLKSFLDWWEIERVRRTIQSSDASDALQVMTVHASKGLGFEAVVVPFATWELAAGSHMGILWCEPESIDLQIDSPLPIKGAKELENTEFSVSFRNELMQMYIDSLNVAYVAFTRAKQSLVIYSQKSEKGEERKTLSDLLSLHLCDRNVDNRCWEVGGDWNKDRRKKGGEKRRATQLEELLVEKAIVCVPIGDRVKIKSGASAGRFFNPQQREGILLHDLLSRIETSADVDHALRELQLREALEEEELDCIGKRLHAMLEHPKAREWFDGSSKVINERDLIVAGGKMIRPDRVLIQKNRAIVIDYKFGQKSPKQHRRQVKEYMIEIGNMGFSEVEGFLWYPESEDPIVRVV